MTFENDEHWYLAQKIDELKKQNEQIINLLQEIVDNQNKGEINEI